MQYTITKTKSKNNQPLIKINDTFIESRINPEKEADRLVQKNFGENHTHIVFGYGSGFFAGKLLENIKSKSLSSQLLIIDPLKSDLKKYNDFNECGDYIYSLDEKKDIENNLVYYLKITRNRLKIICLNKYDELFPEEYVEVLKLIKKITQIARVGFETLNISTLQWQKNIIGNLKYMKNDCSLYALEKKTALPVVIMSGGPSLTKQLDLVKKHSSEVISIVSGSTINSVLKAGIKPDFIVSVDGRLSHYKQHFEHLNQEDINIVYGLLTHEKIREKFSGVGYYFLTSSEEGQDNYIRNRLKQSMLGLNFGTSCANYAFSFATLLTKGNIAFIGQDLAFTGNLTHALSNKSSKEINVNERKDYFYSKGYFGDEVLTSPIMYEMKKEFEKQMNALNNPFTVYNCTEGGLKIEGMTQIPFKQFLENNITPKNKELKKQFLNEVKFDNKENFDFKELLKEDLIIYKEIILKCNYKGKSNLNSNIQKLEKENRSITNHINEIKLKFYSVPAWKIVKLAIEQIYDMYLPTHDESYLEKEQRLLKRNLEMLDVFKQIAKELYVYSEEILRELSE